MMASTNTAQPGDPGRSAAGAVTRYGIPLLPGDGVGPELAEAARACIDAINSAGDAIIELTEYAVGYAAYRGEGNALPDRTFDAMRSAPATLLAALSVKECPPPSIMGQIRQRLELFADIRHCVSGPGSLRPKIDLVMFRECSEGFLSDRNMFKGAGEFMPSPDVALSVRVVTREKCERIAGLAFEYARSRGRKRITVAHKDVVFSLGCGLFRQSIFAQAVRYPEISVDEELVDDLAGHLVAYPERYDMILTTNLFGDILADVAAAQVGSMVPIVNAGNDVALFCPLHSAHTDIAGKQQVNPFGMLRTVAALLRWLGLTPAAGRLDRALAACATATLNTSLRLPAGITTSQVTQGVVDAILAETA